MKERTQVGIIGGGPAGLMLGHLLQSAGIESVVLESRSREYVERRVRAGVLEHGAARLLRASGVGGRMDREGLVHRGIYLQFDGGRHRVDFEELTGRGILVYGQQEVVKDLIEARISSGGTIYFEAEARRIDDADSVDGVLPSVAFTHAGQLRPGQTVLVIGASGGVGTFAVQIAKALGAEVTGVCSARNVEMVSSIGADHVIDYSREDFIGGNKRYDLIFQLAGTRSPSDCLKALNPRGTLVLSSGQGRFSGIDRVAAAMLSSPFVSQRLVSWVATPTHRDLLTLTELIEARKVQPIIDRTYPLDETPAAIRYVQEGHTRGKVVITV